MKMSDVIIVLTFLARLGVIGVLLWGIFEMKKMSTPRGKSNAIPVPKKSWWRKK